MTHSDENDAPEEVVYGAVARAMALAADDPDWMNVTRWPRPIPPGQTTEKGPRRRDYWPDSSRPNWCPCVEGDPHLCKPELHPTSPVHGAGTRPIPPAVTGEEKE